MFRDTTMQEIDDMLQQAWTAFHIYRKFPLHKRAAFMRAIAREMEALGEELIATAAEETHLNKVRLRNECTRTIFQLTSYADACERGNWLEARIDTAIPDRKPPKPDIRKMLVPLGPVVVFGASNFPFAYSTAGGDTACAFAAGCPVIVKAHPAHARTSAMVAGAIEKAAKECKMPAGIFAHVFRAGNDTGKALVMHPYTKAVGFTGSTSGGKALADWARQRKEPIPVFAEMGSINPVFLLPGKMRESAAEVAKMYAASITLDAGQFCTNPGLIVGMEGEDLEKFLQHLGGEISQTHPAAMLHPGIAKNFTDNRGRALEQEDVSVVAVSDIAPGKDQSNPTIATASAQAYLSNPVLHQEVFGPFALVVRCRNMHEMLEVALHTEGQLTATLIATDQDIQEHDVLVDAVKNICGRFILNGVPTGVEVCLSMQHGGPFPATTDSRFTAVGADGIKRFARPICYQNWPGHLLPDELKDDNPLGICRIVNDVLTN